MKLKDIVDNALADATVKMASAVDVQVPPTFGEIDLGIKLAEEDEKKTCPCGSGKPAAECCDASTKGESKEESKTSALEEAKYAMKLAEALDAALPYIQVKMAQPEANRANAAASAGTSHVTAPGGMQVFEGGHNAEQTKHPTIKPATVPLQQASSGGGPDEDRNDGNKTGIETNRADYSDPDWTKNKESALNRLGTKIAQAEDLRAMGHIQRAGAFAKQAQAEFESVFGKLANVQGAPAHETTGTEVIARSAGSVANAGQKSDLESGSDAERKAEATRSERKEGGAPGAKTAGINFAGMPIKIAQDPSSPQPQGLDGAKGSDFLLSTEPGESKQFPGNEEVAGMTKRDAKTRSTRSETAPFVREGAFSAKADPGIAANLSLFRGGEKISSLQAGAGRALLRKIAATENDPNASDEDKTKAASLRRAIAKANQEAAGSLPGLL